MGNIIPFPSKVDKNNIEKTAESHNDSAPLVDIGALRSEVINSERREVKRTILTEFISMHAVVPDFGLLKVALYDINDRGLAFDLEEGKGQYSEGDQVELRVYLNHQTYFPIVTRVLHVNKQESGTRHGCEFISESINDTALKHFVLFLENVTAAFRRDKGDVLVSKINS
jgi:PilZ domain